MINPFPREPNEILPSICEFDFNIHMDEEILTPDFSDEFYQKYNVDLNTHVDHGIRKCRMRSKICYSTKTQAKKARKEFEKQYRGQYYRVYLCDCGDRACGYWHLAKTDDKYKKNT